MTIGVNEYIGQVKMDYTAYCGEDLYSDGEIEDELLSIVQNQTDYSKVITEKGSWPILYHLSEIRENVLSWYPFEKGASVLEVGAGCGAVTGALLQRCGKVVSVDLSKKRSLINAYRHKDAENLEIKVGNFQDVKKNIKEKFDYITLIGVFEYANLYIDGDDSATDFLKLIFDLLKPNGKIIIAIENRLGLKYFAGCKEDHLGQYFVGIENNYDDKGVKTYSKKELENIFESCGCKDYQFFYPYPDYKLPEVIYSDEVQPKKGELINNMRNFDADRLVLFDESAAFDGILEAGLFAEFSNSYIIVLNNKVVE